MVGAMRTEHILFYNPIGANPIKWPNTLKQFVGKLLTNCLSVFGHFVNLALKGLMPRAKEKNYFQYVHFRLFENRLVSAGLSEGALFKTKFLERTLKRPVQPVALLLFL